MHAARSVVHVSIVSHGQGHLVGSLVEDLLACPEVNKVTITKNIPEFTQLRNTMGVSFILNNVPRGFGPNHNTAFAGSSAPFFCVLNPDIRFVENPFPKLLADMENMSVAANAPAITTPRGIQEDSARRFPTVLGLLRKALRIDDGTYAALAGRRDPDWLAGMFLLLRSSAFRLVGGFDEEYFLYYEDVDLCWRLRRAGYKIHQVQEARAKHDARRASRRSWKYARWHLASMARFLLRSAKG